jgi:hypothetical protein
MVDRRLSMLASFRSRIRPPGGLPWPIGGVLVIWIAGCARPQPGLWPPAPDDSAVLVHVYQARHHSRIEIPVAPPATDIPDLTDVADAAAAAAPKFETWDYGERLWFYDDRRPVREGLRQAIHRAGAVFHALFWPTGGVIELTRSPVPLAVRAPDEVQRVWELRLSPEGATRLRAWLAAQRDPAEPIFEEGGQTYYIAARRYSILYTCHHFTARALRSAGVPLHSTLCFLPIGLWNQLSRAASQQAPPANPAPLFPLVRPSTSLD